MKAATNFQIVLLVWNPLPRSISKIIRFPIPADSGVRIFDSEGTELNVVLVPVPSQVLNVPGRKSSAEFEAAILVSDIPALGFRSYYVKIEPAER